MDKIAALVSLNEAKQTIDELILKVKNNISDDETDTRKIVIVILSIVGALVLVCAIAYFVYRYISKCNEDEYDDIDGFFLDDDDEEPEVIGVDEDYE